MSNHTQLPNVRFTDKRKALVIISIFFSTISVVSLLSNDVKSIISNFIPSMENSSTLAFSTLLISFLSLGLIYLQSGDNEIKKGNDAQMLKNYISRAELLRRSTEEKINDFSKRIEAFESDKGLTYEEKEFIIQQIINQSKDESIEAIFKIQTKKLENDLKVSLGLEHLKDTSSEIIVRLLREISDLRLRSNVNLLIGMAITAVGLYLLWATVSMVDSSELLKQLASENSESNSKFIKNLTLPLVPRVMLVIFIEFFSYFFLRLYKNGLSEIKYFQNELTNIESKLSAVQFSYITNNESALKVSLESLSKTERNFILDKGQTTVELEKAKSESELTRNIITTIPEIFKKLGK